MTKKIVRIVSAAIVLVLGISLAGCGKKEETKTSVAIDGAGEGYEFVTESKSINDLLKTTGHINNVVVEDGKVYAVESLEGKTIFHIADLETGEDKTFELDLTSVFPKDVDSENDGEPAGETSEEPTEEGEPAEESKETEESTEEGEGTTVVTEETGVVYSEEGGMVYEGGDRGMYYYEAGSASAYISDMCPAKDGSVFLSVFNYSNEKQGRAMCKLTTDGKLEKLYSFDDIAEEYEGVNYIRVREDGGIYVAVESRVVYVDNTGKTVGTVDSGNWINNLFIDDKDNCYASYYGQNGSECKKVDFAAGQFTDALETGGIYGSPVIASDKTVLVAGYDSVFEVNTETKEKTKLVDGIRVKSTVSVYQNNKLIHKEDGEVLFKEHGLSGIVIFNTMSIIARDPNKTYKICLDLLPDFSNEYLKNYRKSHKFSELLLAFINPKISKYLSERFKSENEIFDSLKNLEFTFDKSYGFDFSQVSVGGIDVSEVDENLMSKREKNVYIIGELLDIDGPCGGYNLTWAFASAIKSTKSFC